MYWIVKGRSSSPYLGEEWKKIGIKHQKDHFVSKSKALKYASLMNIGLDKEVFRVVRKAIVTLANPIKQPWGMQRFFIRDYSVKSIDFLFSKYGYPITVEDGNILPSNTYLKYDRTDFHAEDIYKIRSSFIESLPISIIKGLASNPTKYVVLVINNSKTNYWDV